MTKREVASLVIKLTGIYILIRYAAYLPSLLMPLYYAKYTDFNSWVPALLATAVSIIYLGVCVIIVLKSDKISAKIISVDKEMNLTLSITKSDIMTIAFCCIGLIVLVNVIPQLASTATEHFLYKKNPNNMPSNYHFRIIPKLVGNIIQLVIGIWLFLRAKGLAEIWRRIREN